MLHSEQYSGARSSLAESEARLAATTELATVMDELGSRLRSAQLEIKLVQSKIKVAEAKSQLDVAENKKSTVSQMMLEILRNQLAVSASEEEKIQIQAKIASLDPIEEQRSALTSLRDDYKRMQDDIYSRVHVIANKYKINSSVLETQVGQFLN